MTRSHLGRRLLVAAVATVLFGACRVEVDVAVEAGADGVGTVAVMVRLDADAAAQVPDPTSLFEVADLRAAGWAVEAPEVAPGGAVTVRAEKPFGDIAGAAVALAELSGPDGPFGSLRLDQERTVVGTRTSLEGGSTCPVASAPSATLRCRSASAVCRSGPTPPSSSASWVWRWPTSSASASTPPCRVGRPR